jgi:hypothetical protein
MATDLERELCRMARVHRFNRRGWSSFWAEHREKFQAIADREVRRKLIDNCQCIILCGVGEPVEELT